MKNIKFVRKTSTDEIIRGEIGCLVSFCYSPDVFGQKIDNRLLNALKSSVMQLKAQRKEIETKFVKERWSKSLYTLGCALISIIWIILMLREPSPVLIITGVFITNLMTCAIFCALLRLERLTNEILQFYMNYGMYERLLKIALFYEDNMIAPQVRPNPLDVAKLCERYYNKELAYGQVFDEFEKLVLAADEKAPQ